MIDIAMMVAGVGMQFFNNYANNKKNEELQAKQREFQRAAAEHDFERMRKLQAESAKIALELEEELHKERMNDIDNQYDSILENFAHSFTISNWPLNVLPFIMKGESFGSLIHGSTRSINMHCIFTPSNCEWFNSNFYDDIDLRLEAEMNNNWNAQSTHPIVYYGGAWNRQYGETATIDLNDIDLLRINLRGIPTMIVTPYFDPWLHFRVEIWGMGKDTMEHFRIDIPHGDVEFANRIFSYDYNKNENYIEDEDFQNYTVNEFVPYLRNLIGFVADKYFWGMYGKSPKLPILLSNNTNNSINNISTKGYKKLFCTTLTDDSIVTTKESILSFYSGIKPILNSDEKRIFQTKILDSLYNNYGITENLDIEILKKCFSPGDIQYLNSLLSEIDDNKTIELISELCSDIKSKVPCVFTSITDITFKDILDIAKDVMDDASIRNDVKIEIREENILIALLQNDGETFIFDEENPKCIIVAYENLTIPDRLKINSGSFIIKKDDFDSLYMQIKQLYNT